MKHSTRENDHERARAKSRAPRDRSQTLGVFTTLAAAVIVATSAVAAARDAEACTVEELVAGAGGRAAERGDRLAIRYSTQARSVDPSSGEVREEALPAYGSEEEPYEVIVGSDEILSAWSEALLGRSPGSKLRVVVPASRAYGARGTPVVPAGADLVFEIEVLENRSENVRWETFESGLRRLTLEAGAEDAPVAARGGTVEVHYAGWLEDGTRFDSSRDRGKTFVFQVGRGRVLAGWDEGLLGQRQGSRLRLELPPALAYGATGGAGGAVPPDATVTYEIEILRVEAPPVEGPTYLDPRKVQRTASGIQYVVLQPGSGTFPQAGDRIVVAYAGHLEDGKLFDTTRGRKPLSILVGAGQMIPGWEETLPTMKEGEVRRVRLPPQLGYGRRGSKNVPPQATLYFDIELLKVLR